MLSGEATNINLIVFGLTRSGIERTTYAFDILITIIFKAVDVVEWSRALDVRLREWCSSREEQKFDSSKI